MSNDQASSNTLGARAPRIPDADRLAVEAAIRAAEQTTSAEFIVVVAARSGRYDRAEDLFGLVFGLLGVSAAWIVFQQVVPDSRDWAGGWTMALGLPAILAIFAAWTVFGAFLASRLPVLAKPFLARHEMRQEVQRRAAEAYRMFKLDTAPGAAGVMVYVSMLEHRVLIEPGDALRDRLPAGAFDPVRDALIGDIRAAKPAGASLASAVEHAARIVAPFAPPAATPRNWLPDTLHLLA